MIELKRSVRFCLSDPVKPSTGDPMQQDPLLTARHNTYSAWPAMRGLGRFYQLNVRCQGAVDPVTGYFLNIKLIDQAVREHLLAYLQSLLHAASSDAQIPLGQMMRDLLTRLQTPLQHCVLELTLQLTPYYHLSIRSADMGVVLMRQQFEFAAAHRLHANALSDQQNRQVFGKCNNPAGHGHNYRVEVVVQCTPDAQGHLAPVELLDALVTEHAIDKLDHKHLNLDVPQFASLNPSCENIAMVIDGYLAQPLSDHGLQLEEVSVWETEKTMCTYRHQQ